MSDGTYEQRYVGNCTRCGRALREDSDDPGHYFDHMGRSACYLKGERDALSGFAVRDAHQPAHSPSDRS